MRDIALSHCTTVLSCTLSVPYGYIPEENLILRYPHDRRNLLCLFERNKPFIFFMELLYIRGEEVDLSLTEIQQGEGTPLFNSLSCRRMKLPIITSILIKPID